MKGKNNNALRVGLFVFMIFALVATCFQTAAVADTKGKTWQWYPSTWQPSGVVWDRLVYISDFITRASGGRIKVTPTAPGMVCAVPEQLDAVATGATPAMVIYTDYYSGKMPLLSLTTNPLFLLNNTWELRQYIEKQNDGRILSLLQEELAKYGDVHVVGPTYYVLQMVMNSKAPIDGIDKIKGMKFRSGDVPVANALGALGASVTWSPGEEIYTNLSTGVIDACTYCGPADSIAMGFHEVAKYWLRTPLMGPVNVDYFVVNSKVWNELPDDLKAVVEAAVAAGNAFAEFQGFADNSRAWAKAEELGVTIVDWSEEDILKWEATVASFLPDYGKDAASKEAVEVLKSYLREFRPDLAKEILKE
ncbi:MAG: TRAP transporter substrate-binding protein DctP [Synergistales bacterium]|nr:TRAP transporter substrate-binding protein DctP [Synergistales bacterium]